MAWDACIAGLVLVTGLLVPVQVAFQHEVTWFGSLLVYAIDLFFIVDVALNFRTSYRYQGTEITDRALIEGVVF